ncbi:MAG: hypothetical protein PVG39_21115 [Desulfobacteraceae bacterium]|jgi:hypothetical protein
MKINESQRALLEQQGKINKNRNTDADSFQKIMDQVTSGTETNKTLPVNINPVQILNGPEGVIPVNESFNMSEKDLLLGSLKETLDLVDFYAGKLADESFPVENLSSLVDQLDERLASIKDMSSMEGVPEKLKPVITDVAVTIGTEIERFRRGDYI